MCFILSCIIFCMTLCAIMQSNTQQTTPFYQEQQPLLQGQPPATPVVPIAPPVPLPQGPSPVYTTPVTQVVVLPPQPKFGDVPVRCVCPNCQREIVTVTSRQNGLFTWLLVGGLCLIGCVLGCCLIPLCIDSAKDTVHTCPNCHAVVGIKKIIH
jgi:lipopolysaccharide-induced tumor necrosis factor-alpha factor